MKNEKTGIVDRIKSAENGTQLQALPRGANIKLAYLASPYTHPCPFERDRRMNQAALATKFLIEAHPRLNVFSPIIHSHILALHGMKGDWAFWKAIDTDYIRRSNLVIVFMLDGWRESVGVQAEIRIAKRMGRPIRYLGIFNGKFQLNEKI